VTPDLLAFVTERRNAGLSWDRIAACVTSVSVTGDQLRKRYTRARQGHRDLDNDIGRVMVYPSKVPTHPTKIALPGRPKILVLPDTQVEAGVKLGHFLAAGRYAAEKRVDAVVHIGDFGNFTSLSTYENPLGKEGLRLRHDIDSCHEALELFRRGLDGYAPKVQMITLGNHEARLNRYVGDHPELEGLLSLPDFARYGWTVYPFLQPVSINGVYFAHYFTRTAKGWAGKNPHPNAQQMTRREMVSCVAGHTPGLDTYIHPAGGGAGLIRGTIAGSFYQHDEAYQGPQGNRYWRGMLMLHEVSEGYYNLMEVSMEYLLEHYGD
jgi:hypothetical protein